MKGNQKKEKTQNVLPETIFSTNVEVCDLTEKSQMCNAYFCFSFSGIKSECQVPLVLTTCVRPINYLVLCKNTLHPLNLTFTPPCPIITYFYKSKRWIVIHG